MGFFNKIFGTEDNQQLQVENQSTHSEIKDIEDIFQNGKLIKKHVLDDNDELVFVCEYKNEEEIKRTFYDNGHIKMITEYEDGEEFRQTIYKNGYPSTLTEYEDSEKVKETNYYDNGHISRLTEYENGEEIKETSYDYGGNINMIYEYEHGETVKETTYKNGQVCRIEENENGKNSITTRYENEMISHISEEDEDFNIIKDIIYKEGKLKLILEYKNEDELRINYEENKIINIIINKNAKETTITYDNDNDNLIEKLEIKYSKYLPENLNDSNTNSGFIYVLVNSSIKDMVKIGKTTRSSEERAKEISSATGVPTPFIVAFDCKFNNCSVAETHIHKLLEQNNNRTSKQREFFNISSKDAISLIMKVKEELDG